MDFSPDLQISRSSLNFWEFLHIQVTQIAENVDRLFLFIPYFHRHLLNL